MGPCTDQNLDHGRKHYSEENGQIPHRRDRREAVLLATAEAVSFNKAHGTGSPVLRCICKTEYGDIP